ncbi:unnamed protein product [Withania somnifera]
MLIGIGKDLLVHVLEGSIHGNHHYFLPRACQAVRVFGRFPFAFPPHSPLVGRVVNLEGVLRSPLLGAGVLGRWGFLFLNQFGCVSLGLTFCYELAGQRWIEGKPPTLILCHLIETSSVLLTTPRGQGRGRTVIPGFAVRYISIMLPSQTRHLMCQSQTVVLPSEGGTTPFSFALLNLPFLISSSKPLYYWYRGQIEGCSSSPADPLFMRQCNAAEKGKPLFILLPGPDVDFRLLCQLQQIWISSLLRTFPASFFLSIGRLRADRSLPGRLVPLEVCPVGGLILPLDSLPCSTELVGSALVVTRFENLLS